MKSKSNKRSNSDKKCDKTPSKKTKSEFFNNEKELSKKDFDDAVANFIINNNEPFTLVRNKAFQELMGKMQPLYKLPCYETVLRLVGKKYDEMMKCLKKLLKNAEFVSVTTDGWTSTNKTFLGYTVSYLDENLKRHTFVLACRRHIGKKNFQKVGQKINQILEEFEIHEKTVAVTTDGGSEYAKAFRIFGKNEFEEDEEDPESCTLDLYEILANEIMDDIELPYQVRCMAHNFNLLAKYDTEQALTDVSYKSLHDGFFSKFKSLLKKQNYSPQKADIIREKLGRLFKIPGDTRWNGKYDSVTDFLQKIESCVDENFNNLMDLLELPRFKKKEIQFASEYVKVMEPIARAINEFQKRS